jgi:hypothetical protein
LWAATNYPQWTAIPLFAIPDYDGDYYDKPTLPGGLPQVYLWLQNPTPWQTNCNPYYVSSGHTAGMNASLADGSVRFLSPGLSVLTWSKAVNPADGQVLGSDW